MLLIASEETFKDRAKIEDKKKSLLFQCLTTNRKKVFQDAQFDLDAPNDIFHEDISK